MLPVGMSIKIGEERMDPVDGLMYVYTGESWKALIETAIEELPGVIIPEEVTMPIIEAIEVLENDVKIKDIKK